MNASIEPPTLRIFLKLEVYSFTISIHTILKLIVYFDNSLGSPI